MKENSLAISVSLLFHMIIVALFLQVPFDQYIKPKLIALDFFIEKERLAGNGEMGKAQISNRNPDPSNLEEQREQQVTEKRNTTVRPEEKIQRDAVAELSVKQQGSSDIVASDPAGQTAIFRDVHYAGTQGNDVMGKDISSNKGPQNIVASSGKGRVLNYENNGADERDFIFIRDTILKRIKDKYPDRARRMGLEGKVLLSFVVLENGSINNVKIVNSSGFRILDDNAKEVIEKTIFTRKIPYSRLVQLPVEYKLQ